MAMTLFPAGLGEGGERVSEATYPPMQLVRRRYGDKIMMAGRLDACKRIQQDFEARGYYLSLEQAWVLWSRYSGDKWQAGWRVTDDFEGNLADVLEDYWTGEV